MQSEEGEKDRNRQRGERSAEKVDDIKKTGEITFRLQEDAGFQKFAAAIVCRTFHDSAQFQFHMFPG